MLEDALDRVARGDWSERRLPALAIGHDGDELTALNDLVLVRAGAGQVMVEVAVDGERFIRLAGDGIVAATPLGSTAYTLASGGPMLAPGASGMVLTPLSPHGGSCPPLVAGPESRVTIRARPGQRRRAHRARRADPQHAEPRVPVTFELELRPGFATLVSLGEEEPMIAGLRRRRILMDSPRVLARDERQTAAG